MLTPAQTLAASNSTRGLQISPLKQYATLDNGSQKIGNFTVANLTASTMQVDFSVKRFSVSNYTYNYTFSKPKQDWVHLSTTNVTLAAGKSKTIPFTIDVPKGSRPGGYYYTFVASANVSNGGIASTLQATSLLYLTVKGQLITTGQLLNSSISKFSLGKDIAYKFDIRNTGNVHYFVYPAGHLMGALTGRDTLGAAHLILPGTVRSVESFITAPLLPGIYRAEYGYRTSAGTSYVRHAYVVYVPLWSITGLLLLGFGIYKFVPMWRNRRRRR